MQSLHRTRGGDGHQGSKHYDAAKVADPQAPEFFAVVHLPLVARTGRREQRGR
jgi:hypothetical protein